MAEANIIGIVNQKGGTGKTTSCVNLGIDLAREGKKVLIADCDPQGSATISLGHSQPDALPVTLSDLMVKVLNDVPLSPGEGILHHEEGVDILPANITLAGMEVSLVNAMSRETTLKQDVVHRYIRLNSLEQPLRDKVDSGELAFTPAVELSYLKPEEQQWLQNALEVTQQTPSLSQAQRIKKESKEGTLSEQGVMEIMSEEKKPLYNSVTLSHDTLKKYFPKSYTAKQMEKVIIKLLDNWLRSRQRAQER